jgi:drug/metabolite transporter (DMT)-like permease
LTLIGFTLVIVGPLIALRRPVRVPTKPRPEPTFQPRLLEGYTFALLSSAGFGVSPVLVRHALDAQSFAASIAGGLVSYAAASGLIVLLLLWPGQRRHMFSVDGRTARWFSAAALFAGVSQMARYMALSVAPVTVVTPIQRLSLVFRLLFSWFLNRDHEVFTAWMLAGVMLSFTGAGLLSLEIAWVVEQLPAAWRGAAQWHWP